MFERGIDICHETVRLWWHRFGRMPARFTTSGSSTCAPTTLDGEVLESFVTKEGNKAVPLKFIKKAMNRHGRAGAIVTDACAPYATLSPRLEHRRHPGVTAIHAPKENPMASDDDHNVHALNGLIATTLDSADGYRKAAAAAENPSFKTMFSQRAQRRQELTTKLQAEVRRYGGEPEDDGTALAKAHRAFLSLKDIVTGHSDKAVIEEVERGEDFIKAKFEHAAKDDRLAPLARQVVDEAAAQIKADHDEISALKHSME